MSDLETFKAIQRAVAGVPMNDDAIRRAIQRVRDVVANPEAPGKSAELPEPTPETRTDSASPDRLHRSGRKRGPDAAA